MAETSRQQPIFVLDGMSLVFRAFFALPPELATSDGLVTNAVHGFASMLLSLIRDHSPGALAVAFDLPGGTFRDELVDDYKGGRDETPDDLLPQFDLVRELVEVLNIPLIEVEGFEADDVLATLATRARDEKRDVVVVTGDRDCFQLVEDPFVRVLYNRRGVSDYSLYDEAGIIERTGVEPARYSMLSAMRGDPSDNLPGVPGVGEKTAAKLLNSYGDLDGIFAHLDEMTPKLKENMTENESLARQNYDVMQLIRDVPLDIDPADLELGGWVRDDVEDFYERLEMRRLWMRTAEMLDAGKLGEGASTTPKRAAATSQPVDAASSGATSSKKPTKKIATASPRTATVVLEKMAVALAKKCAAAVHVVGLDVPGGDLGVALCGASDVAIVASESTAGLAILASEFPLRASDSKILLREALRRGVEPKVPEGDVGLAAYLLDAAAGDFSLAGVLRRYLPDIETSSSARPDGELALDIEHDHVRFAEDVVNVDLVLDHLEPLLAQEGLSELYERIELPLVLVLARMEDRGILIDREVLQHIADDLSTRARALEASIQEMAGRPFKVNSTQQLQQVLYEDLDLPKGRKTKTGFSTDAGTLEKLLGTHPIIEALLSYRELEKLRSTYGESLLHEIHADGRIHATFKQTVARTGRLSSEQPNLHNIPVRSEEGRRFREAFIPTPGWEFLVADYDQVELRIIAHLAGDPGLLAAFEKGEDIHRSMAADVFSVDLSEVSYEQREYAKMVSYGLAYGMEAFGLATRLGTSVGEAKEIMERYFTAYPGVKEYMDRTVAEAKVQGFTRTELGRIRPLPELFSGTRGAQAAAERQAMNAGIQGLAADIFKVALVRLDTRLRQEGREARIVLQVHDEVIVEVPPAEREAVEVATREELNGAASLSVPLRVSLGWGDSWASAKG
jgi:DNA polymerase-1